MKEHNLVVKKYRDVENKDKVYEELDILVFLEEYQGKIVHHLLFVDENIMGFTLPFYRGMMWDKIIQDENSIFRRSPLARVRLIVKIAAQMR